MSMYDDLMAMARKLEELPPPTRLELDPIAWSALRREAGNPPESSMKYLIPPVARMTSIPVVVREELLPGYWQLVEIETGEVVQSGFMVGPTHPETGNAKALDTPTHGGTVGQDTATHHPGRGPT